MNKITLFNYEGNTVRTVMKDGNPWWVLKDVCSVLDIGNSRDVMARLDSDEKGVDIIDTPGGKQEVSIINESGLYSVILVSRKPEAKKFKRWVTHEVLPSIRRHGLYATDELLANPDFLIQALQELKAERAKNAELTTTISIQEQQIAEMKPKASYYDVVLNCKDAVSITTIAKDYGKSGRWFNEYLHNLGVHSVKEKSGFYIKSMLNMDIRRQKPILTLEMMGRCIQRFILTGLRKDACSFMSFLRIMVFYH